MICYLPGLVLLFPGAGLLTAQDTLILKNGRKADCRILDFTAEGVKIAYRLAADAPPADRVVPLPEVDYIELAPLPGETEAVAQAIREGRSEPLITYWVKRLPWLNRPRTNGGEIGLTYAELLTRIPTADRMERALKIYQQIESSDWSAERRGRAQAGRLRVMLRQGRTAEVRPLAEALLRQSGDPRVLIELRHVMAEASAASLAKLEEEHPRWEEEDELVPRHAQLFDEALDGYLYSHLFHGAEEDLAARGLWAAAQLAAARKRPGLSLGWAMDLVNLYPSQAEASAARSWLEKNPDAAGTPESKSPPEVDASDTPNTGETGEEPQPATPESKMARKPVPSTKNSKPKSKSKPQSKPNPRSKTSKEAADE